MNEKVRDSLIKNIRIGGNSYQYFDINELENYGYEIKSLPNSIKILLENALRNFDDDKINLEHIESIANWHKGSSSDDVSFMPTRILLQDFTGVPAVVDLAAMRESVNKAGINPKKINPTLKVDLVIDHSLIIDYFGDKNALESNVKAEFERNIERYKFLKWAGNTFDNFKVYAPNNGIIHQINLEKIATVSVKKDDFIYPDSLVGTDSHTTMINGLGVFGFGVGGIEAEAAMLGQPIYMTRPEVIGVEITGEKNEGIVATDIVLTLVNMLRKENVVGKIVEYFGEAVKSMDIPTRATIANMAPEYGATCGYFSVDEKTIDYLKLTGRDDYAVISEVLYKKIGAFGNTDNQKYTKVLKLDLSEVKPALAGHKRPQDKIGLSELEASYKSSVTNPSKEGGLGLAREKLNEKYDLTINGEETSLSSGDVVIAAITSCTNTSNPEVLLGAGLIAKKAVELGLSVKKHVKTSLTPGSKSVTKYLKNAGLLDYFEKLGFNVAGYGCATCIGNGGALIPEVEDMVIDKDMVVASVLSGNRNFEGRIHQNIKLNYLASPMLVMLFAIAGTVKIDLTKDSIGVDNKGNDVFLKDLWPSNEDIKVLINKYVTKEIFTSTKISGEEFDKIKTKDSQLYDWDEKSTYIRLPNFFDSVAGDVQEIRDLTNLKLIAALGDSVTTDHISPAGAIAMDTEAGQYLLSNKVEQKDFNSYGTRRGNHEVMMRGTFANIRVRNKLAEGTEGGYTKDENGNIVSIFSEAMKTSKKGEGLIVIAGKEYGTGSSRDWAAKGPALLGVKAVIAQSYERIHRSNLVGMGILPLEFKDGENFEKLGLIDYDEFSVTGLSDNIKAKETYQVIAKGKHGVKYFDVISRLDSMVDIKYYRNGGILHTLLREMIKNT